MRGVSTAQDGMTAKTVGLAGAGRIARTARARAQPPGWCTSITLPSGSRK